MMVAGPDPTRLTRLDAVPEKFPITTEHLQSVPELAHETLESALAAGRVYWVDHAPMSALDNGRHPQAPKYMYSPMVAFAVPRSGGPVRPFAIQCGQDPAGREIYTPADGYSWKLAKNCVLVAHNTYHGEVTHLGRTHLISEAVLLAAVRNLASVHPVAVLLRRHFEGTASINKLAVELLIQPGRAVEYLIGSDLKSTYPWIADHRKNFSFTGNYLPAKLERSGTDGVAGLPYYPYRDDGLLVWTAIRRWAGAFVDGYYRSDADVREDHELQAWAAEVASPDGGAVRDFGPTPGEIDDRNDLAEILTMVIWTAGPQHAAVNFTQLEHLSYLPANPLAGFTDEPRGRDHTLDDWLANLPPLDVAVQQLCLFNFLGSVRSTTLGDYEDDFKNTPVANGLRGFRLDLSAAEDEVTLRNRRSASRLRVPEAVVDPEQHEHLVLQLGLDGRPKIVQRGAQPRQGVGKGFSRAPPAAAACDRDECGGRGAGRNREDEMTEDARWGGGRDQPIRSGADRRPAAEQRAGTRRSADDAGGQEPQLQLQGVRVLVSPPSGCGPASSLTHRPNSSRGTIDHER